jgi:fused signal recognition particle receptor
MEIVILLVALAVVIVTVGGVALVARRSGRGDGLEPPPSPRDRTATLEGPPEVETGVDVEVDETLAAEVEDALAAAGEDGAGATTLERPPERVEEPLAPVRPNFRDRLAKARGTLGGYLGAIRSRSVDDETWDEIEEALIRADVGVAATGEIIDELRSTAKAESIADPEVLLDRLKALLKERLSGSDRRLVVDDERPNVWLFVGVNGVGKTTTIGKVARQQQALGRSVVMAAGDTFRAAATEQLGMWAERTESDIVRGSEGGDPSSVVFDAVQRAAARGTDLVLGDTAGRLHTKSNLMDELRKVRRVADRDPGNVTEVLLVLDATTGQNGLAQARQFTEAVDLTGVVLTKLDGSAKGGIALAIQTTLGIPIKLVGLGESVDDLVEFDPDEFVDALFS